MVGPWHALNMPDAVKDERLVWEHPSPLLLCFPQKLDPDASASDAKSLFHWLRGRCMPMKRMMRIQFL